MIRTNRRRRSLTESGERPPFASRILHAPGFAPLVGVASATPVLAATVRAVHGGWAPSGDDATIVARSFDVLTAASPQLGQYSVASPGQSTVAGQSIPEVAYSPGPMLYWLFALPARWGPTWTPALLAGVLGTLCFVAVVVLAARRGGPGLAVATGLGLCLSVRAVEPWAFASVWNPVVALAPFMLLVFLGWSIGVGEVHFFPVAILIASFVMQCHLTFALPSIALLTVATAAGFGPAAIAWFRQGFVGLAVDLERTQRYDLVAFRLRRR